MKKLFAEIKDRWTSKSPIFFKKIRTIAICIVGTSTAIWTANSTMNLELNETLLQVLKYVIVGGIACGLTANLTKDNSVTQP